MRILLVLLLGVLCASAQIRYSPTSFTAPFISTVTNQSSAQTYLGISSGSGAPLDGTNVWTGTNTFTAANFYPANNIGLRLLWSSPTNIYISTSAASATPLTNNGDFASGTALFQADIPPLLGQNSSILFVYVFNRTNGNFASPTVVGYIGSGTNFIWGSSNLIGNSSTPGFASGALGTALLQSANSWTNQTTASSGLAYVNGPGNFCNTSQSNTLRMAVYGTTAVTNILLYGARLYEVYAP